MKPQALWLPGEFPTTNKLLDYQRSTGYLEGKASALRERVSKHAVTFPKVVAKIRNDVHMAARSHRLVPVVGSVPLIFVHLGSGRRDPSSWYLAGKVIEDGLVDAGVLGSDRFNVAGTSGRCVKASDPMWQTEIARLTGVETGGKVGMLVMLGVPDGFALG